jgi:hypothetical protein
MITDEVMEKLEKYKIGTEVFVIQNGYVFPGTVEHIQHWDENETETDVLVSNKNGECIFGVVSYVNDDETTLALPEEFCKDF